MQLLRTHDHVIGYRASCVASLVLHMKMPCVRAGSGTQELAGSGDVAALPPPTVVERAAAAAEGPAQSLGPGVPICRLHLRV